MLKFPLKAIAQANRDWKDDILGHGDVEDKISLYGCFLTAFTSTCNAFGVTKSATPRTMNLFLRGIPGAFTNGKGEPGVLLNLPVAAKAVGLYAPESMRLRSKIGDPALSALAIDTVKKGGVAIIHVDHNDHVKHDGRGDHFIATGELVGPTPLAPAHFRCMDPAPATFMWLDEQTMSGPSVWAGVTKHFRAVGVAPVFLP